MKINSINLLLTLGALVLMNTVMVSSEEFEEGKHYIVVEKQSKTNSDEQDLSTDEEAVAGTDGDVANDETTSDEIAVVEYFSYGCTHCYRLEPFIDTWLETKGEDVEFSRVALATRSNWIPFARAYYMAEVLGVTEKVHSLIFRAIYVNKQPMGRPNLLKRMFTGVAEVEPEKFDEVLESDEIPKRIQNAAVEVKDLGVTASPTLVVAGTYLITPETAGDLGYMFDVVDFLVEKIKAEREMDESTATN